MLASLRQAQDDKGLETIVTAKLASRCRGNKNARLLAEFHIPYMPIKRNAITRRWQPRCAPAGSQRRPFDAKERDALRTVEPTVLHRCCDR